MSHFLFGRGEEGLILGEMRKGKKKYFLYLRIIRRLVID